MTLINNRKVNTFICTATNHKGTCDDINGDMPEFSLQRLSTYVEAKKELDKKLRNIPGGNIEDLNKLYKAFDDAIEWELELANEFKNKGVESK